MSWESITKIGWSVRPGITLGAGVEINKSFEVGINYFLIAQHSLTGTTTYPNGEDDGTVETEKMKTNFLTVNLGVKLDYIKSIFSKQKNNSFNVINIF